MWMNWSPALSSSAPNGRMVTLEPCSLLAVIPQDLDAHRISCIESPPALLLMRKGFAATRVPFFAGQNSEVYPVLYPANRLKDSPSLERRSEPHNGKSHEARRRLLHR